MTVLRFFGVAFLCVFYSMSLVAQEWVTAEPAVRGIKITGFTRAQAKMPLISEVSGKVVTVYADVGEPIPQSGLFACLDDVFVKIDIQSAQNAISRHYGDIKYFKKEVERHKKLVRKQTSAVTVLDNLERKLNEARHLAAIESLRKKRLQELKKRHCIKAPPGWLVTKRDIEPGQWVNEGQVLGEAGNYQQLSIPLTLSLPELQALKAEAASLKLFFPDIGVTVPAKIDHISPAFDEKTRKIRVDLRIEKFPSTIQGGMRCELTLNIADQKSQVFTVPKQAIEERFEEYWLQRKDGKRIRVKLLSSLNNERVQIRSTEIRVGDQFKRLKK
ncbi:efflux RND transporter periplasmic adaptor subunit [methane-oxidizing endosymbiont of Gigantopelta aegis]|uniref:efflux RND transporter periplasmic adaptor subunit n=1 Tax=methane-oxidizing endosymbiont of Gigantopelta aegis TaxID=2794938 RepID=UPI0018DB59E1|nr:efflux RND transporter periplasmic adaptor subunit [methane-oxidizing endosymbiont of Gigantopelta aegis]